MLPPCKQPQGSSSIPSSQYSHNPLPSSRAPWPQRQSSPAPKGWRGGKHPQSSLGPVEASLSPGRPPIPIFLLAASDPVDKEKICLQRPAIKVERIFHSSLGEALKAKAKGSVTFSLPHPPPSVLPGETGIIHMTSAVALFCPLHPWLHPNPWDHPKDES